MAVKGKYDDPVNHSTMNLEFLVTNTFSEKKKKNYTIYFCFLKKASLGIQRNYLLIISPSLF